MRACALCLVFCSLMFGGRVSVTATESNGFDPGNLQHFIRTMARTHGFNDVMLKQLFRQAKLEPAILTAIAKPAESKPWYQYRSIFLTQERVDAGVVFWRTNAWQLHEAYTDYGVSPEIIVAIIGVETFYGRNRGKYRVIDALATLAFNYPERAAFFRGELEHFLLLTRDQRVDPLLLMGSYAGAMGLPQFMPSSYRSYAVDFDSDGVTDIWQNSGDAIGSVGNYLRRHGWQREAPIVVPASVRGQMYLHLLSASVKPTTEVAQAEQFGVTPQTSLARHTKVTLIELQSESAMEYWLACNNFYVLTRYNQSPLYAMAVYQLAEAIRNGYSQYKAAVQ